MINVVKALEVYQEEIMRNFSILFFVVIFVSCATKMERKDTLYSKKVDSVSYDDAMIAVSKLLDTDGEKLLYDSKDQKKSSFRVVEYCRPEALGKLELVFNVDISKAGNGVVLSFEGVSTRYTDVLSHKPLSYEPPIRVTQGVLCNKEEITQVYNKVIENIEASRIPASK